MVSVQATWFDLHIGYPGEHTHGEVMYELEVQEQLWGVSSAVFVSIFLLGYRKIGAWWRKEAEEHLIWKFFFKRKMWKSLESAILTSRSGTWWTSCAHLSSSLVSESSPAYNVDNSSEDACGSKVQVSGESMQMCSTHFMSLQLLLPLRSHYYYCYYYK